MTTSLRAGIETGHGRACLAWKLEEDALVIDVAVPFNTSILLDLPAGSDSRITADGEVIAADAVLGAGSHHIRVERPQVTDLTGLRA